MNKRKSHVQIIRNNFEDIVRIKILEFIQMAFQNDMDSEESLTHLKRNIELTFKGKWQVVIGNEFTAYLNENDFPYFLEIITKGNVYMIFSRGANSKKSSVN